jgi:hypothetical protein
MEAWAGVVAAVAGAAIALLGQWVAKRGEQRRGLPNFSSSSALYWSRSTRTSVTASGKSERYNRPGGSTVGTSGAARLASARMRILCDDADVLAALDEIGIAGKELGAYWRRGDIDEEEFERRYEREKTATARFLDAAAGVIRSGRYGL